MRREQRIEVRALIEDPLGRILLIRRSKTDNFLGGYYEVPGGRNEYGEHAEEAVRREVMEEIGIKVMSLSDGKLCTDFPRVTWWLSKQYFSFYFRATVANLDIRLSSEHDDYGLFNLHEILGGTLHLTPITEQIIFKEYLRGRGLLTVSTQLSLFRDQQDLMRNMGTKA